ncbi:MAG: glycosyltransferase family 4 protein [Planctomycetota bacterium]|nr:glycosyltransferase family 4 protein [Planctomycetota bacterium]
MKIALAIMTMELGGGAEHDIVNLSAGLKKAGHEPLVITSGGRLCKDIEAEGVPIVLAPLMTRGLVDLWRNGRILAEIIERHQVDVFNPQGVYPAVSGYFATRRLLKRGRAVPNIVTIHMLQRLTWWYYKLGAFMLNHVADHVIFESDCELLRLRTGGMKRPSTVIYNCFPPDKFDQVAESRDEIRRQMGWPDDRVVFLMPARMTAEKGHDVLLRALARPELQGAPLLCYLAGDGALSGPYQALASQLGVADKVVFGGFRRDLPALYKAADVFLLCSKAESLPLSIREGMVASLPILSTNVGGISEAVEDGSSGLLLPSGDPAALARAMVKLASDASLRAAMGRRGHEIHCEKFDYDHWIARTVEVMSAIRKAYAEGIA